MKAYANHQGQSTADRDRLIAEHIDAARRISLRVARRCPDWITRDDLVAAGMMGLAEAAERYDDTRNEPFISFAEKRIRGAVLDELRRGDIMPRRVRQMARKVGKTIQTLEHTLGRTPEDEEVAAELGVSIDEYRNDLEGLVHVSIGVLDTTSDREDFGQHGVAELPSAQVERAQLIEMTRSALDQLPERDALIMSLYYNDELTYAEIAVVLGVTTSRVCQLHSRAIARLRAVLTPEEEAA